MRDGNSRVVSVACPEAFSGAAPINIVPKLKVTLPVAPDGVTVAVGVTGWLSIEGFGEEVNAVVVGVIADGLFVSGKVAEIPLVAAVTL